MGTHSLPAWPAPAYGAHFKSGLRSLKGILSTLTQPSGAKDNAGRYGWWALWAATGGCLAVAEWHLQPKILEDRMSVGLSHGALVLGFALLCAGLSALKTDLVFRRALRLSNGVFQGIVDTLAMGQCAFAEGLGPTKLAARLGRDFRNLDLNLLQRSLGVLWSVGAAGIVLLLSLFHTPASAPFLALYFLWVSYFLFRRVDYSEELTQKTWDAEDAMAAWAVGFARAGERFPAAPLHNATKLFQGSISNWERLNLASAFQHEWQNLCPRLGALVLAGVLSWALTPLGELGETRWFTLHEAFIALCLMCQAAPDAARLIPAFERLHALTVPSPSGCLGATRLDPSAAVVPLGRWGVSGALSITRRDGSRWEGVCPLAFSGKSRLIWRAPSGWGKSTLAEWLGEDSSTLDGQKLPFRAVRVTSALEWPPQAQPTASLGTSNSPWDDLLALVQAAQTQRLDLLILDEWGATLSPGEKQEAMKHLEHFPGAVCWIVHRQEGEEGLDFWGAPWSPVHPT